MESLRPVLWGQGTFVTPQHFQQQDAYHDTRLQQALPVAQPFYWGLQYLSLNEAALQHFRFEVDRCDLILPDGTMIRFQSGNGKSNAKLRPRDFEEVLTSDGRPLGIYLGVKRWQRESENLYSRTVPTSPNLGQDAHRRFHIEEIATPDVLAADGQYRETPLRYLLYDLHVLFDTELSSEHDYDLIKIGEVVRATEGSGAVLSQRHIPPVLSVSAAPVLAAMLRDIRDLLTAKSQALAEFKPQQGLHRFEPGPRDLLYMLMTQMVNRYAPLFHHYLAINETHPSVFYALLRQLIGEFSTFSREVSVLGGPLPDYRHDQLWTCFEPAIGLAKSLLAGLTRGPDYVVSLRHDGECFTAQLEESFFQSGYRYYLAINVDMSPNEVLRRLSQTGKISAREDLDALRGLALFGVRIEHQETPPEALPRQEHCMYFALDHHADLWRHIAQYHNIAIYCELPPQDTVMQLMLVAER